MRKWRLFLLLFFAAWSRVPTGAQTVSPSIAVVSAADYYPSVAPGSIASVFGAGFTKSTASATLDAQGNLPLSLNGVSVYVQNVAAGLFYVSPGQVNFLIPPATMPGQATITVVTATGQTQTGQVAVLQSAPGIFVIAAGRGAILNAISGGLEPFDVYDSTVSDHHTRLAVYATGLNAQNSPGTVFLVYAAAPGQPPVQLDVEYAGPQGQFFGLDQMNVVLPPSFDGIGDVQLFIRAGEIQSNSVLMLIRSSRGPSIQSVSPSAAQPNAQVTISGQYFALEPDAFESSPRNVLTFQQNGQVVLTIFPQSASPTQLQFSVPYDVQANGGYLTGTFDLCLTTDGRTACSPQPVSIEPLQKPTTTVGTVALDFISALQHYVDSAMASRPSQIVAAASLQQFDDAMSQLQNEIQSTLNGQTVNVSLYGPNGPHQVQLTVSGIAAFDSLLSNAGTLASIQAAQVELDGRMTARALRTSQRTAAALRPPSSTEADLLSDAENYQALLSVEYGVTATAASALGKTLLCGLDIVTLDGASAVATAVSNVISGSRYYYEFSKIFLSRIDITPFYVSMNPGDVSTFAVSGEFIQSGAAPQIGQAINDYFSAAVKSDLEKEFGKFSCGSLFPYSMILTTR